MRKFFPTLAILISAACFARADDAVDAARAAARNAPSAQTRPAADRRQTDQKTGSANGREAQNSARGTADQGRAAVARKVSAPTTQARESAAGTRGVMSRAAVAGKVAPNPNAAATDSAQSGRSAPTVERNARAPAAAAARGNASRAAARPVISSGSTRNTAAAARNAGPATSANRTRAAATTKVVGSAISPKYSACKETYFSCMDEFCANKDASLRRCACSSRMYDFEDDKKVLEKAQTKLADFQERLLAVNMDEEDVEAMVNSTAGEDAYNVDDVSESQKQLNAIMKKINEKTTNTRQTQSLAAITLSTMGSSDMFDSVDSMMGSSTAAKEGEALYRAALPTCLEMAEEICEADDIPIIQSAYQMSIEQDCNTLLKNYQSLRATAMDKTKEASALLDMSRLTNFQDRNSADLPTCSKQMMEIMNTEAICGADLGKCLDPTGKYIDPTTGEAILSNDLGNLINAIKRPDPGEKWADKTENSAIIKLLESKKTFVEPAMGNCETIQRAVWDNFVEDALSKIKIAHVRKLEDMRQKCVAVVGQCKSGQAAAIENFDERMLSIFGVVADRSVNDVCEKVQNECGTLITEITKKEEEEQNEQLGNPTGTETGEVGEEWKKGMEDIDLQKTYETILQNCRLVGRECVQQMCQTNESQFGLCNTKDDAQRGRVLDQNLFEKTDEFSDGNHCYNEVLKCIKEADGTNADGTNTEVIKKITEDNFSKDFTNIINATRWPLEQRIGAEAIAKHIWGWCSSKDPNETTNIIEPGDNILNWFAENTGEKNSCYFPGCKDGEATVFARDVDKSNGKWTGQFTQACKTIGTSGYEWCGDSVGNSILDTCESNNTYFADGGEMLTAAKGGVCRGEYAGDKITGIINILFNDPTTNSLFPTGFKTNSGLLTNCCYSKTKDALGNCCDHGMDTSYFDSSPAFTSTTYSNNSVCDRSRACCFGTSGTGRSGSGSANYCKPKGKNNWKYVTSKDTTHLFCMGEFSPGTIKNGINNCTGTYVTVDGSNNGIYRSRLAGGIEKYLNYVYVNTDPSPRKLSHHHKFTIYLPQRDTLVPGWYYDGSDDGAFNSNMAIISRNSPHTVAYCENGFLLHDDYFECCVPSGNVPCPGGTIVENTGYYWKKSSKPK